MNKTLFRLTDIIEVTTIFLFCFITNILIYFWGLIYNEQTTLIAELINSIAKYRYTITSILTVLVVIYLYQFIKRRKKEIVIRYLVGDVIREIKKYYLMCLFFTLIGNYIFSLLFSLLLSIPLSINIHLLLLISCYCLLSTLWVRI